MGIVFDIQRCCYHDGPGIRTTVFLKGCNLRCAWCHNPESFAPQPQLKYVARNCLHCGKCAAVCPHGVHTVSDTGHRVDFQQCIACGTCTVQCPGDALAIVGKEMSVDQVMDIVRRDTAYYHATGGGLTVSGGEPTYQHAFLQALLESARQAGISTALETNGYIAPPVLSRLAPLVDLFLLDFKLTAEEGLTACTRAQGTWWEQTLDTLTRLNIPVILRLPVIPGINDTAAHFADAAALQKEHPNIQKLEIMAYHAIGAEKWEELGLHYTLGHLSTVPPEQAAVWNRQLEEACARQQ